MLTSTDGDRLFMITLAGIVSFSVAILFCLTCSKMSRYIAIQIRDGLQQERANSGDTECQCPSVFSPQHIADYVEYGADVAQVFAASILPFIALVLAAYTGSSVIRAVSLTLLVLAIPASFLLSVHMLSTKPVRYAAKKYTRLRLSQATLWGIAPNALGLLVTTASAWW